MRRKIVRNFFVFQIIPSEFVALNCLYQEENTCHRNSVCQETAFRFWVSLTETFCRTSAFPVMEKYGKGAVLQI